eukprot:3269248-Prymnesium_polylepis.1
MLSDQGASVGTCLPLRAPARDPNALCQWRARCGKEACAEWVRESHSTHGKLISNNIWHIGDRTKDSAGRTQRQVLLV